MNTAAHAHAPAAILDAARAGFATVEHVSFMTGDRFRPRAAVIDALVSAGTFASLTAGDVCADQAAAPPLAAKMLQCLATVLPPLRAAGARIVLGSDAGIGPTKPHDALVEGVRDAVRLGVDGAAALRMVTGEAAEACGVQGRKGRLAPGADADLLVLGADPVLDMAALTEVRGVYRLGHPVHGHDAAPSETPPPGRHPAARWTSARRPLESGRKTAFCPARPVTVLKADGRRGTHNRPCAPPVPPAPPFSAPQPTTGGEP